MESLLQLPTQNKQHAKILQITDMHLFADDSSVLLGVNSNASFLAVLDEIKSAKRKYDLIVATGDFVQDGSKHAYQRFAEQIISLKTPCVWLAGNHDKYSYMQSVFAHYDLADNKVVLLGDKWIIILLNSQVEGQAYGFLSNIELEFLQHTLAKYPDKNALVFLHHHPISSSCHWLDQHILKNSCQLEQIVQGHQQIKGVGWGHIHQEQDHLWHHCLAFSTPSTCVQFKPNSYDFQLADKDAPGWREIKLNDNGSIDTSVFRICDNRFVPDLSQNGY